MASLSSKSTASPPPMDLKHTTSNSALTSKDHRLTNRTSQYTRGNDQRLGSPTSIPSSPTSIRSSSSAIFERDIEPIVSPSPSSPHHQQTNPHRIPRAKGTEQLEQSVPSVLDSAAAILTGMGTEDLVYDVAVVSPATSILDLVERNSGFASPIGSLRSRSPSPVGSRGGQAASTRAEVLLTIPVSPQAPPIISSPASILGLQNVGSPFSPPPPSTLSPSQKVPIPTIHTAPFVATASNGKIADPDATPALAPASDYTSSQESSPKTTTLEHFPPVGCPTTSAFHANNGVAASGFSMASPTSLSSHPSSPVHLPRKRLSFMSYSDLLSSTPTTTHSLSSLTTCATVAEPPPHIPSVSGLNIASTVCATGSIHAGSRAPSIRCLPLGAGVVGQTGGVTHPGKRDSIALLDNMGGEWEREGLGKGLDERLDALILSGSPAMSVSGKA